MSDNKTGNAGFNPFAAGEILKLSPTTIPQREILASAQVNDEANTAFNETVSVTLHGQMDIQRLEKSFKELILRHDILRSTFSRRGDQICLQDHSEFKLEYINLSDEDASEQQRFIQALWKNIGVSPMNLEEGPMFFAWAIECKENLWELILSAHHLIIDGWSYGILLTELSHIYNSNGDTSGLPKPESYLDFAEEIDSRQITNKDIDFWKEAFDSPPPPLDLPLDFSRPAFRTFSADRYDRQFDPTLAQELGSAAARLKASTVHYVFAAYATLLNRLSGNSDIVIGLPVAGQPMHEKPNLMGHMVQLLPIRVAIEENMPFSLLVSQVKNAIFEANERPNFSFGKLVENMHVDRSRVPLIATIFNIDQAFPTLKFGDTDGSIFSVPRAAENFELFVNCVPAKDNFTVEVTYSTKLFEEQSIVNWFSAFEKILQQATLNPEKGISEFDLQLENPVVSKLNDTEVELEYESIEHAFCESVSRYPNKIAVRDEQEEMTYQALNSLVDNISGLLLNNQIGPGDIVALCTGRHIPMLASALAIQKVGACYLPLDPSFPEERLAFMLEDSKAKAIIFDQEAPEQLRTQNIKNIDCSAFSSIDNKQPLKNFSQDTDPESLAYVIYTSGSTGKPKGVEVPRRAAINFLESMSRAPGLTDQDTLLAVTTLSFDISVLELFLPLVCGATVKIATKNQASDSQQLKALLAIPEITVMQATPATWRMLLADGWIGHKGLKAFCGGEPLTKSLAHQLLPSVSELWNMYGPTETTVWSTCKRIYPEDLEIDIGGPIANTTIHILDSFQNVLPPSFPGELCIGGKGVTRGYIEREELTNEKFLNHPKLGRIYRTGDRAKITPDGRVVHLGRLDDQIKIRGFRVELGDIESAIDACTGVAQSAVYLWDDNPEDLRLIACCVAKPGSSLQAMQLRKTLRNRLPGYMIPHSFLILDDLPKTPNGKIDRKRLPKPEIQTNSLTASTALDTKEQQLIADIWQKLVKPELGITKEDNFFEIGGHSLLAMEAIRQIEHQTNVRLSPRDLIADKLENLAEKIQSSASSNETESKITALDANATRLISPQQRYVIDYQLMHPESTHFKLPASWHLKGSLDRQTLTDSLEYVVSRQTALRSIVNSQREVTLSKPGLHEYFTCIDLRNQEDGLDAALKDIGHITATPIQPLNRLLFACRLYCLSENEHLLFVLPHQAIFDGWSFDIFLKELEHTYQSKLNASPSKLDRLSIEYSDFSTWRAEHGPSDSDVALFANAQLAPAFPNLFATLCNHERGVCKRLTDRYSMDQFAAIESLAEQLDLKAFELFFAIYAIAVTQEIDGNESVIGVPVAGRNQVELISLIGSFVTTLPLFLRLENGTFKDLLFSIKKQLSKLLEHQNVCLYELLKSDKTEVIASRIDNSFGFQDIRNRPVEFANIQMQQVDIDRSQTELPFECWVRINATNMQLVYDFDDSRTNLEAIEHIRDRISAMLDWAIEARLDQPIVVVEDREKAKSQSLWKRLFS